MNSKRRKDCVFLGGEKCNQCLHPDKGMWVYCDTMHMTPFDSNSCQIGMYQKKKKSEKITMKLKGVFTEAVKPVKTEEPFYLRLVEASSYPGSVAVEAVDKNGERISLICRISKEKGIEAYRYVNPTVGLPLHEHQSVVMQETETS